MHVFKVLHNLALLHGPDPNVFMMRCDHSLLRHRQLHIIKGRGTRIHSNLLSCILIPIPYRSVLRARHELITPESKRNIRYCVCVPRIRH